MLQLEQYSLSVGAKTQLNNIAVIQYSILVY